MLTKVSKKVSVIKNILHCLKHGTQMGWLIDPSEQTVFVFRPKQETEAFDELNDVLPVPGFASDLQLRVGDLFAWLLE
ncbi:MAG: Uma2 family endonuclease [Cyanobacteria bacterium J06643_5]